MLLDSPLFLRLKAGLVIFAGLLAVSVASAAEPVLVGRVSRVLDGDTLEVQLASGPIHVRMYSIDAPEKNQPWGPEAKAALERRVLNRTVSLQVQTQDRYSRVIADVYVGESLVNAWLVAEGDAWAYRDYLKDTRYCQWEEGARANRRGLWSLSASEQVAPWLWRKAAREKTQVSPGVPPCPAERRKRKPKSS